MTPNPTEAQTSDSMKAELESRRNTMRFWEQRIERDRWRVAEVERLRTALKRCEGEARRGKGYACTQVVKIAREALDG